MQRRLGIVELGAATVVYALAASYVTWPLILVGTDHVLDHQGALLADIELVMWILSWGAHALSTAPQLLFDGNAFHPLSNSITFSEHLLGDQVLFLPVWGVTGNPVLGLNTLIFASALLSGLFMHMLVRRWSDSTLGAFVAGLAIICAPWRQEVGRPHLLQMQYLPLVLLLVDRAARHGRLGVAIAAATALTLQILCSYYLGYMAVLATGLFAVAWLLNHGVRGQLRTLRVFAVTLLMPALVVVPLSLPYLGVDVSGAVRPPAMQHAAAGISDELVRFADYVLIVRYVGLRTLGFALIGALGVLGWRRNRALAVRTLTLILIATAGVVLARGTIGYFDGQVSPYRWLATVVPGFAMLRVTWRFMILTSVATCALAGLGVGHLVHLSRRFRRARMIPGLAAVVVLAGLIQPVTDRPEIRTVLLPTKQTLAPAYTWLTHRGVDEPILELPIGSQSRYVAKRLGARAMFMSTFHWQPIVNGYSGYIPPAYLLLERYASQLPTDDALQTLVDCTGVRWLLVQAPQHHHAHRWSKLQGVRSRLILPYDGENPNLVYEVIAKADQPCHIVHPVAGQSVQGHPVAEVTPVGRLVIEDLQRRLQRSRRHPIRLRLVNEGSDWWPATALDDDMRVFLHATWESPEGQQRRTESIPVPRDVAPGDSYEFDAWLRIPSESGPYRLRLDVRQGSRVIAWHDTTVTVVPGPSARAYGAHGPTGKR